MAKHATRKSVNVTLQKPVLMKVLALKTVLQFLGENGPVKINVVAQLVKRWLKSVNALLPLLTNQTKLLQFHHHSA
jgi:hypothetical protein